MIYKIPNIGFLCKYPRKYSTQITPKPFHEIPGPKCLPIVGTLWKYLPLIGKYKFDRLHWNGFLKLKEFGPLVREEMIPGLPVVWVFKPEDIEMVYRCEGRYPERRSHLALQKYRLDRPEVYNSGGLLPTNGPEWWRLRRIFQKDLNKIQNVRSYLSKSDYVIKDFMECRISKYQNDFLPELDRLYLELTGLVAFDELLGCFSGKEIEPGSKMSELIDAVAVINGSLLKTDNGPQLWRKFDTPLYKKFCKAHLYLEEIAKDFVYKKVLQLEENPSAAQRSLLKQYLLNEELDIKDVIGMAADLLLGGIHTMSYTSAFGLYHLSRNIPEQEIMFEELNSLMTRNDSITETMLNQATYTRAVIKEIFRLSPISVGVGRILAKDAVLSEYFVPSGTIVVTQNQITCRLPEYFQNPEEFKPERWIRGNHLYKNIHPYLVLPFGHGPRTCIARRLAEQNFQLFLMNIIRRYKLEWKGDDVLDSISIQINKPDKMVQIEFMER
ncbi:cytochrome P450 302a1, mitochondrial-like [Planococcus citri]|uniref:cytochrome P450 302a1, mitochondrial-like n=1 Tax=Planococcus citri TaxID=170843 RepID=UPI0031F82132